MAGRLLAGRGKPPAAGAEPFDPASGSVRMKLAFIERWPVFDEANPILIKEMRQMFRNLTVPVIVVLGFASGLFGLVRTGQGCFYFRQEYAILLTLLPLIWLFVVISNLTEHTREEAQSESRDLLFVTLLTPGQIVRGKWGVMVMAALAVLLAMLPHALLWGVVSQQWLWVLAGFGGLGLFAILASLALLILALFPLSRTVFQVVVVMPMFFCFLSMAGLNGMIMGSRPALFSGGRQGWLDVVVWVSCGLLLTGILASCLYILAVVMVRRRPGAARWLALLTLAALPVLLLVVSVAVVASDGSPGTFLFSAALAVLAVWLPWQLWFRPERPTGGVG
jgi:hypothetical protein